jgi:hypothetical protein
MPLQEVYHPQLIVLSFMCGILQVLFQNDSLATLLARVVGILGPIDPALLAKGKDTHKFFTKNHMLYERNQVHNYITCHNLYNKGSFGSNFLYLGGFLYLGLLGRWHVSV